MQGVGVEREVRAVLLAAAVGHGQQTPAGPPAPASSIGAEVGPGRPGGLRTGPRPVPGVGAVHRCRAPR